MTFRLTPNQRTALARKLMNRATFREGLTQEQRAELCRHALNLEAANKLEARLTARMKLH